MYLIVIVLHYCISIYLPCTGKQIGITSRGLKPDIKMVALVALGSALHKDMTV